MSAAICLKLCVRPTHHYHYSYPRLSISAAATYLVDRHEALVQLSGNEACTALLWRSVQGYRWDSCEPQGALMATNLAPLQSPLTFSANGTECQRAS